MDNTPPSEIYACTPLQEGLLLNSFTARDSGIDIIQVSCYIPEALNIAAFTQAWQALSARTEILRTAFRWENTSGPEQHVFMDVPLPFHQEDWRDSSPQECEERLSAYLKADRQQGFTLWYPPLWRLALLQVSAQAYYCVFTFHHAILDGRSLPIILQTAFAHYRAIVSNQPYTFPHARPYHDYVNWWQQQAQKDDELFWRQTLAGFEMLTPLPEEKTLASGSTTEYSGVAHAEANLSLTLELSQALRQFAAEHQLTLNTVLQGAWAMLLGRYSDQRDVIFGEIRSCRYGSIEGSEYIIGFFLNTLPMRVQIEPGMQMRLWLQKIRQAHLAQRPYQRTSLTQITQWSEVPPGQPLFQSLFVFEKSTLQSTMRSLDKDWLSRRVKLYRKPNDPLACYVFAESEILLTLVYDAQRFAPDGMQRLLARLRLLLTQIVAAPDRPLEDFSLLLEEERQQLLITWNATDYPYDADICIHRRIEQRATSQPSALALQAGTRRLTYAQLNAQANRLAHWLRSLGVGPEQRVGVCIPRSPELIIGQLGVLKAGGAFVSLDPDYPQTRRDFLLADAQVQVLLTLHTLLSTFADQSLSLIALDAVDEQLAHWPDDNPEPLTSSANLAYIIYTSGSTGRPKGVMLQHDGLANLIDWHIRTYALTERDRTTQLASPAFDASIWEVWPALVAGASIHVPDQETVLNPRALTDWFVAQGITIAFLPTPLGEAVLQEVWPPQSALRALLVGGDRLQRRPGAALPFGLYNHYGLTETTVVATWTQVCPDISSETPSIGSPMDNTQVYLLDENGLLVPRGSVGEIYIGGAGLARGYLLRPELTAERFVPHPWSTRPGARLYRTGDLARYRADGQIEFLGRRDQQVKIRGYRIELGEIESTLTQHPAIATALVLQLGQSMPGTSKKDVGAERNEGNDQLVAYVAFHPGTTSRAEELRSFLSQRLPAYMIPAVIVLVEAFPLTSNGKIDRRALPVPTSPTASLVAPRTPLETTLAEIWGQVLPLDRPFGVDENFFELGGHSLLATQIILLINERLQLHLPIQSIFEAPTIAGLAAFIDAHRTTQRPEEAIPRQARSRSRSSDWE